MKSTSGKAALILAVCLLPSLVWLLIDAQVWTYDPAWYGESALRLALALKEEPARWPGLMLDIQKVKAPGIAWLGQFFALWGRPDLGLMLFVLLTQFLTLLLIYLSAGLCAAVSLAASPLFVAMSHEFYAEPLQALAVAWFVFIMVRSRGWSRQRIIGNLMAASALAMAAKISSPLYCLVPGLIAVSRACKAGPGRARIALWGGAFLLVLTAAWYLKNGAGTLAFARMSFSDGEPASWWDRLRYWATVFRLGAAPYVQAVIIGAAMVKTREGHPFMAALAAVLLVFSFSANPCARYLLPALVFIPILLAWALERLDRPWLTKAALACFFLQFAVVHAGTLGLLPLPESASASAIFLRRVDWDPRELEELEAAVDATCREGSVSMFGVSRLRFNATSAGYTALKRGKRDCQYWNPSQAHLEAVENVLLKDPLDKDGSEFVFRLEKDPRFRSERLGPGGRVLLFRRLGAR